MRTSKKPNVDNIAARLLGHKPVSTLGKKTLLRTAIAVYVAASQLETALHHVAKVGGKLCSYTASTDQKT